MWRSKNSRCSSTVAGQRARRRRRSARASSRTARRGGLRTRCSSRLAREPQLGERRRGSAPADGPDLRPDVVRRVQADLALPDADEQRLVFLARRVGIHRALAARSRVPAGRAPSRRRAVAGRSGSAAPRRRSPQAARASGAAAKAARAARRSRRAPGPRARARSRVRRTGASQTSRMSSAALVLHHVDHAAVGAHLAAARARRARRTSNARRAARACCRSSSRCPAACRSAMQLNSSRLVEHARLLRLRREQQPRHERDRVLGTGRRADPALHALASR